MSEREADKRGFNSEQPDIERTVASQGGPATGIGDATNRSASLEQDAATKAAAASTSENNSDKQKNKEQQSVDESDSDGNLELPEGK